jgi:hypothetical protein
MLMSLEVTWSSVPVTGVSTCGDYGLWGSCQIQITDQDSSLVLNAPAFELGVVFVDMTCLTYHYVCTTCCRFSKYVNHRPPIGRDAPRAHNLMALCSRSHTLHRIICFSVIKNPEVDKIPASFEETML